MNQRPRRNRKSIFLRDLVRENEVSISKLVMPLFVVEGEDKREEIPSMPGIARLSLDLILAECRTLVDLGIKGIALFPALDDTKKDDHASESKNENGLYLRAIREIKKALPELVIFADVAMDPYSTAGHDGLVSPEGEILNDETLPILAKMAVAQAKAGADFVAPSDMMDGRIAAIREALDSGGYTNTGILSYAVKYASAFYGPFRDALQSAPRFGDKKTYQMDSGNAREALLEVALDESEGADILMVKPGLPYLDIVRTVRDTTVLPVAVYNVSGEYAMLRAAAQNGWLEYRKVVLETMLSFRRAGADIIFTYHAKEVAEWLK